MRRLLRRYESTIYGPYRAKGLLLGAILGVLMALYIQVRHWMGSPVASPADLGKDAVMLIGIIAGSWYYRHTLESQKVTLKELMLLGLWMGLSSAVVYGLYVWLYCGVIYPEMTDRFASKVLETGADITAEVHQSLHNPLNWAIVYGMLQTAVTSIIVAFFSALIWRNEKAPVKEKKRDK